MQQNQALANYRQQLETERQRYQDLFNLAPDGYLVSDAKGIIQAGNVAITVSTSHEGGEARLHWLVRDNTEKKQAEAKIHRQAFYDQLTGLPNRAFLDTYLPKVMAKADRQQTRVAVACLDLDK